MNLAARIIVLVMAVLAISPFAKGAEIKRFSLPGGLAVVNIQGDIVAGDAARFTEATGNEQRVSVILRSDGGALAEALKIGAAIRMRNYSTMVPAGFECHSACALIWVSGARRYMSKTSKVGFHAAYRKQNGEARESGMANAEVGSFLTHLGMRIEAIRYFTVAGPGELALLTPDRARQLGIEVFETRDQGAIATPNDAPTADSHADTFVSYSFLQARCAETLGLDKEALAQGLKRAFDEGNRIVGPEKWVELWTPMLDDVKAQISAKGVLGLCLETEAALQRKGRSSGIRGPSFDCLRASPGVEQHICGDPGLWAKDRAMNQLYLAGRAMPPAPRKQFLKEQRNWMSARDRCTDRQCLHEIYDRRLDPFKKVDLGQANR